MPDIAISGTPAVTAEAVRKSRIMALDVMRGLTIVCMIIVNNAGGPESYAQLQHSDWNGLTVCDLVFPFFLFIMGVTTYLSMSAQRAKPLSLTLRKVFRRTLIILLICWALHWFDNLLGSHPWYDFGHLRLTGVLTRIALCYCIVSLLALRVPLRGMIATAAVLLGIYAFLLLFFNGYSNSLDNVNALVDRFLLPEGLLYTKRPVDPEGLLGTIPAVAHTIIGYCCGYIIKSPAPLRRRVILLLTVGGALIAAGLIVAFFMPLNKRVWSPSYTLLTCGLASAMLSLLIWLLDMRHIRSPFTFFESFGVNPLFLYVLAEALAPVLEKTGIKEFFYNNALSLTADPCLASAVWSVSLVLLLGLAAYPLYRRRIYIKI